MGSNKLAAMKRRASLPTNNNEVMQKTSSAIESLLGTTAADDYKDFVPEELKFHEKNDYSKTDTQEELEQFADAIQRDGVYHSIVVNERENGDLVILSGERRTRGVLIVKQRVPDDIRFQRIHGKLHHHLTPRQEMIVLDGANLMTRGTSVRDEARQRKAVVRFVGNVREEYDITEEQAVRIASSLGLSEQTIRRNLDINRQFTQAMQEYLDQQVITKTDSLTLLKLTEAEQNHITDTICGILAGNGTQDDVNEFIKQVIAAIEDYRDVLDIKYQVKKGTAVKKAVAGPRTTLMNGCRKLNKDIVSIAKNARYIKVLDKEELEELKKTLDAAAAAVEAVKKQLPHETE